MAERGAAPAGPSRKTDRREASASPPAGMTTGCHKADRKPGEPVLQGHAKACPRRMVRRCQAATGGRPAPRWSAGAECPKTPRRALDRAPILLPARWPEARRRSTSARHPSRLRARRSCVGWAKRRSRVPTREGRIANPGSVKTGRGNGRTCLDARPCHFLSRRPPARPEDRSPPGTTTTCGSGVRLPGVSALANGPPIKPEDDSVWENRRRRTGRTGVPWIPAEPAPDVIGGGGHESLACRVRKPATMEPCTWGPAPRPHGRA